MWYVVPFSPFFIIDMVSLQVALLEMFMCIDIDRNDEFSRSAVQSQTNRFPRIPVFFLGPTSNKHPVLLCGVRPDYGSNFQHTRRTERCPYIIKWMSLDSFRAKIHASNVQCPSDESFDSA